MSTKWNRTFNFQIVLFFFQVNSFGSYDRTGTLNHLIWAGKKRVVWVKEHHAGKHVSYDLQECSVYLSGSVWVSCHPKALSTANTQQLLNKFNYILSVLGGFPGGLVVKNPAANAGDTWDSSLIPGSGRSAGGGNGNPCQYSCLENPMDRGAWWATVHGVGKSWTRVSTEHVPLCWGQAIYWEPMPSTVIEPNNALHIMNIQ